MKKTIDKKERNRINKHNVENPIFYIYIKSVKEVKFNLDNLHSDDNIDYCEGNLVWALYFFVVVWSIRFAILGSLKL